MLQSPGTLNYGELFVITFSVFTQWHYMYCVKMLGCYLQDLFEPSKNSLRHYICTRDTLMYRCTILSWKNFLS